MNPIDRLRGLVRRRGAAPPSIEAAARAKRARDHLERRRSRERERRTRERRWADEGQEAAGLRRAAPAMAFAAALGLGGLFATPLSELLLLHWAPLERVAIQGARALNPQTIAQIAGLEAGRPLDAIDPGQLREAVASEPWIESARTLRLPSGTLVISVVEREAIARWRREAEDEPWLIDRRGRGFAGRLEPAGPLPLIEGPGDPEDMLSAEAIDLLVEIARHPSLAADPEAITLHLPDGESEGGDEDAGNLGGYVLQIGQEGPRAFLGRNFLAQRVARLAALLESEKSEITGSRWIDLRYADRAVLRTKPVSG
ncbi:MAG: FtsQ-type POTRA domain-containing protein [Deltaproteobacteria bacterium]|nr:FtsQ-type POTRA domain-containing protein [Deltaproteobacteria bacterium]